MALARKWRPAQFADIVGQTPVVRTLMNAVQSERVHQAYLFTGSRGIGKTSIARILAKAVRCPNIRWDGQWLSSCDQCSSCLEITHGNSVDVIEIDGASNNGVDHVREIRENAKFLPSTGSRKVYIIDEVHMLSTAAFNALLKTLEEPPAHILFVLATTEPHKIPATILSRCQRFDLKRVSPAQIQNRLMEVLKSESIEIEPAAVQLISRSADGGLRDALSLLDQVIAFSGSRITTESVRQSIGLIESQLVLKILAKTLSRDALGAVEGAKAAYQRGHDLKLLTRHLIEFLHGVILAKIGFSVNASEDFSQTEWQELQDLSKLRELEELELIFQVLHHSLEWIAHSPNPNLVLDVILIKCASAEALLSTEGSTTNSTSGQTTESFYKKTSSSTASFEGLIQHIREKRPLLANTLEHFSLVALPTAQSRILHLAAPSSQSFYKEQLLSRQNVEILHPLLKEYFGSESQLKIDSLSEVSSTVSKETIAAKKEREIREQEEKSKKIAENHPVIVEARALFGGELSPVEILSPESSNSPEGTSHAK